MSGIVGIVNLDGKPVDPALLDPMTKFMTFRGPDVQGTWLDGHVGFGHTLLRTTDESEHEHQPFTLDGRVWIVADARVDERRELIASLRGKGQDDLTTYATDVELILRAYETWGEDCVDHLLGDFAFAVWDSPRQTLFLARDHLGVKPLFYAHVGQSVIFSNTLDCIRHHPNVSAKLNDLAIADFLLFGINQEQDTTCFAEIRRLAPAHCATWATHIGMELRRYWTLPIDEPLFFRKDSEYMDRFLELLQKAVSDRLRCNRVGVFMSGGLDSTSLAAITCQIFRQQSKSFEVRAFTTIGDGVLDNKEEYYAGLVAAHLGIPIHYRDLRTDDGLGSWDSLSIHTPEPVSDPASASLNSAYYREVAGHNRVCFFGEGPDNALHYEWQPYLSYLLRQRNYGRLLFDVCNLAFRHKRIPIISGLPHRIRERRNRELTKPSLPEWLNHCFESRLRLRERWEEKSSVPAESPHPIRPVAYNSFNGVLWEALFRDFDAESMDAAMEVRHPFVDLRLLRYMLSIPAVPWCRIKYLMRRSMRHTLPAEVLRRPKAPVIKSTLERRVNPLQSSVTLAVSKYLNLHRLTKNNDWNEVHHQEEFRPAALNYWLTQLTKSPKDHSDHWDGRQL